MDWDYSRHYARFHPETPEHDVNLRALFQRWLGAHLPAEKDTPILDVGCGRGYALEWLRGLGYTNLAGVDTDAGQVAYAQSRGLDVKLTGDTAAFLGGRPVSCGLVLLMDVLEHLPRGMDREALEGIHGVLRPGGKLVCTVPNALSPLANHWRHVDYTHQSTFTMESLEFLLVHAGFQTAGIGPVEFIAGPRWLCWPPNRQTLRWWLLKLSRLPRRLSCLGELGWQQGRHLPLSPNLLAVARRD